MALAASRTLSSCQCSASRRNGVVSTSVGPHQQHFFGGLASSQPRSRRQAQWRATASAPAYERVLDCMTYPPIYSCSETTTIDEGVVHVLTLLR